MVNFYVSKMLNGDINTATDEAWKIEDVPSLWQKKVKEQLEK